MPVGSPLLLVRTSHLAAHRRMLPVLDLHPVLRPAALIRPVAVLGDEAFKSQIAGGPKKSGPISPRSNGLTKMPSGRGQSTQNGLRTSAAPMIGFELFFGGFPTGSVGNIDSKKRDRPSQAAGRSEGLCRPLDFRNRLLAYCDGVVASGDSSKLNVAEFITIDIGHFSNSCCQAATSPQRLSRATSLPLVRCISRANAMINE
jgi:hypothetical protein